MPDARLTVLLLGAVFFGCSDSDDPGTAPGPVNVRSLTPSELVARGQYLVDHLSGCADCHTPRDAMGAPIAAQYLAGAECFVRLDDGSCLHSANLTNDATGLMNRTDAEIKRMVRDGVRPAATGDELLFPVMPYYVFHGMTEPDLSAVVAYLRTVPGVEHGVPPRGDAFDPALGPIEPGGSGGVQADRHAGRHGARGPATPLDDSIIPAPVPGYAEPEAALRGRYLATQGLCIVCHSRHVDPEPSWLDYAGLYAGGEEFEVGLPTSPYAGNITSDPQTGIGDWSVDDIVQALRQGTDKEGDGLCPPMPNGPMGPLAGLTDQDTRDIAHYIKSLPPVFDATARACPFPPL